MSFFERYETLQRNETPSFPALPVRVSCINTYLKTNGLRLAKIIGEGSYSKVRLCIFSNGKDVQEKYIACKVLKQIVDQEIEIESCIASSHEN